MSPDTALPRSLRWFRRAWLVALLAVLMLSVTSIDDLWRSATRVGATPEYLNDPNWYSLSSGQERALEDIGLSADWHAALVTLRFALVVSASIAMAGLLWRSARTWAPLLLSWFLLASPILTSVVEDGGDGDLAWWVGIPTAVLFIGGVLSTMGLLIVFPDDRHAGRAMAFLLAMAVPPILAAISGNDAVGDFLWNFGMIIVIGMLLVGLVLQVRRIRRSRDKTARDLLIIAVVGLVSLVVIGGVGDDVDRVTGSRTGLASVVRRLVYESAFMAIPLLIGMGVLWVLVRRGHWDMDLRLKGSVGYMALSTIVVIGYFGTVGLVQAMVNDVAGQSGNTFAVMLSTGLIAAVLLPIHRRLRDLTDRVFDRRRRHAERLVADFERRAATQDIPEVADALLDAVDAALRPERAMLWVAAEEAP